MQTKHQNEGMEQSHDLIARYLGEHPEYDWFDEVYGHVVLKYMEILGKAESLYGAR